MRSTEILLVLIILSISCGERNAADERLLESDSKQIFEELELPEGYVKTPAEIAEILGVSPHDIMLCGLSFTLDEKSRSWIYRFDDTSSFSHAILLRWSDYDQHPHHPNQRPPLVEGEVRTLEVFRETISNEALRRTLLTPKEAIDELAEIEDYLIAFLGEEKYEFYYEGGTPDEFEHKCDLDGYLKPKTKQEMREFVNYFNHYSASGIASEIRHYRKITGLEQGGAEQPNSRSESDSERDDKPQPEPEERSR